MTTVTTLPLLVTILVERIEVFQFFEMASQQSPMYSFCCWTTATLYLNMELHFDELPLIVPLMLIWIPGVERGNDLDLHCCHPFTYLRKCRNIFGTRDSLILGVISDSADYTFTHLSLRARTWLQLPGAAQRSTTLLTPLGRKQEFVCCTITIICLRSAAL